MSDKEEEKSKKGCKKCKCEPIKTKATLEYDLDDFDSKMSHLRAVKSLDMAFVLWEIMTNLKKKCEWRCDSMGSDSDQHDGMYAVFDEIGLLFDEHNINVNELVR